MGVDAAPLHVDLQSNRLFLVELPHLVIQPCRCRCYELRCVNSIVPGNYTVDSDGPKPTPYLIEPGQLTPVYDFPTNSPVFPVDGYNRTFPGNVLNTTKMLFTQCWNQTAADPPVRLLLIFVARKSLAVQLLMCIDCLQAVLMCG